VLAGYAWLFPSKGRASAGTGMDVSKHYGIDALAHHTREA
jgi:flavin-dependent dehydrogenase